ncbi:hypothetical protein CKO15_08090 [Halorhodospira abdelmalekii]|uniref:NHLP leader peptide family RiPP precursor n=1 Tax=Halorhodospira abdelmalekii TaxID=421629 RepID=UPI001903DE3E|nr:NHLP leader peptide family RiPP precursor [Halorhodospira abdelmalekii]MBK1735245.1 hypothetical protein [Halorhodospira abdelmalekii]
MDNQIYSDAFWEVYAEILVECWSDEEFKERFKREPETVFKEWEFDLPEGLKVSVMEQGEGVLPISLPPKPQGFDQEIAEEDLDAVAGGLIGGVFGGSDDEDDGQPRPPPTCK